MAKYVQPVCHDTLPWLISFSLGRKTAISMTRLFIFLVVGAAFAGVGEAGDFKRDIPNAGARPVELALKESLWVGRVATLLTEGKKSLRR
jgi:hypothetical protein